MFSNAAVSFLAIVISRADEDCNKDYGDVLHRGIVQKGKIPFFNAVQEYDDYKHVRIVNI